MRAHAFGALVTHGAAGLQATHLPILDRMLNGIVAFAIDVVRLEARFKLSQEKLPVERERIVATLEASGDTAAVETARLMRRLVP